MSPTLAASSRSARSHTNPELFGLSGRRYSAYLAVSHVDGGTDRLWLLRNQRGTHTVCEPMRPFAIALLCALLVGCAAPLASLVPSPAPTSTSALSPTMPPTPSAAASASTQAHVSPSPVAGGCGSTQVFAGPGPDADLGLADNPWAPATPPDAGIVAYFWYPSPDLLFAHGPSDRTKVLWVSHGQQATDLTIAAHPFNASSPVIRFDFPPASSPVGNYPSAIDLPGPGCWRLEITLGMAHATIDVMVAPAR